MLFTSLDPSQTEAIIRCEQFLKQPVPMDARWLCATSEGRYPRVVATAAWWTGIATTFPDTPEKPEPTATFRLRLSTARQSTEDYQCLINTLAETASNVGCTVLVADGFWPTEDHFAKILATCGFAPISTKRRFGFPVDYGMDRVIRAFTRILSHLPSDLRIDPISQFPAEKVWPILAPHGLMTPHTFAALWREDTEHAAYGPMSGVLHENGRIYGLIVTTLHNRQPEVPLRIVSPDCPGGTRAGNALILKHLHDNIGSYRDREIIFEGYPKQHLETANLASRMNGRLIGEVHFWARRIGN